MRVNLWVKIMTDTGSENLRDRLVVAMLPHIPFDGWGYDALRMAADDIGVASSQAQKLFPGGARDLIAWHSKMADMAMVEALSNLDLTSMKIRTRIATAVRTRLEQIETNREAVRKGLNFLTLPTNAALGLELLYQTVDDMWHMAGDTSTDWNFYSKRMLLSGVYSSTLLCWLNDTSEGYVDTWDFLDRRISDVMKVPQIKSKITQCFDFIPRRMRAMRSFKSGPASS